MGILRAPPTPPPTLSERIDLLHAELEAWIDAKVAEEAKACKGFVPAVRIKHDLMGKVSWCLCSAAKYVEEKGVS
jgi:hypothetical protein